MERNVQTESGTIQYDLQYKKVKNVNLRIKPDGTVSVSAGRYVSKEQIDAFVLSKTEFIRKALEKYAEKQARPRIQYFTEGEIRDVVTGLCRKVYPYYEERGIRYPEIRFRKMVSRWGSCQPAKGILTFNINLMYAPLACIEYVILHEFTHFLHPNHSDKFYEALRKVCPGWQEYRKMLREVHIR